MCDGNHTPFFQTRACSEMPSSLGSFDDLQVLGTNAHPVIATRVRIYAFCVRCTELRSCDGLTSCTFPFAGSRLLRDLLAAEGSKIGRRQVTTLMKRMGIEALYRRPRTTLSVSAARRSDHATEPGLGDGHQCAAGSGVRDGGWSPAIGLQERVANHRKRRWSKAGVVSVTEKALQRRQVGDRKANTREPPFKCRKCSDDVETGE